MRILQRVKKKPHKKRIDERNEQFEKNEQKLSELQKTLSLRERVKNIFKKYGFTVTAVFLAVGTVIGAIVEIIIIELKKLGTSLGNGLKNVGSKLASSLPGNNWRNSKLYI